MKVLVFGRTGQVATELQRQLPQAVFLGREQADLADPAACAAAIRDSDAAAVINAAAWTAVDKAEAEEAAATVVNGEAPAAMARAAAQKRIPFLHVSTDYVFSGAGSAPWVETDPVAPQNAYGRSKLAGEQGVRAAGGAAAILRTSWVFSAHGANFVKTMLRLSESRDALNVVEDQIGGPTPAADIAAALVVMARKMVAGQPGGTYHFGGSPWVSWADFAREIFALSGRKVVVTGIPTAAYPTPALRPLNSRMDCAALTRDFGIAPPDWQAGLSKVLKELEI
ncbi:dTDP-4-dehydrorhamnose reductase [Rhodobacter capsulatus]|uniref:dTDP-4-dehydrorhamnose reductase n=1 Tax=Rhodobacter capsulatus TaxID=1061 RepID=UPI0006DC0A99|nr:dTDP-4-dehydrorhamnose reductase [Rhodobacter capsulatus]KQB11302.1 dTDP-4-dehydrorhamnose reductase [Rhodobacter capsulatus]KQB14159.1 dTDP-4-dehydrorhamnose reductase [Rhodobacter capsulatus]PZX22841.1 dTDP-4-dehydrorhamnose reductase [Rhodobacter capsulatus]QNR63427.1 dTDP-4-dehydrorhamnose reductase [Rhodobacter capsulatus]